MQRLKDREVLVTGGAGFIGSNLSRRLVDHEAQVTIVDSLIPEYGGNLFNLEPIRDRVWLNISDVRDEYAIKTLVQGKEFLFNLAGQTSHLDSMKNPFPDLEINARAQLSILEACRRYNPDIRIVFASTRQLYGKPEYLPVDENHPIRPVDVNGINKLAGEQYHLLYDKVYDIPATVLRLTNTYGPCMRVKDTRQTFLGSWIKRLIDEEPLRLYGTGEQLRDFNYVDDVVDALIAAALDNKARGKVYNLGSDETVSLKELAETMISIDGQGSYEIVPFPENLQRIDIGDYYADSSLIQKELDWCPKVSLREGLEKTLDFYREYAEHYFD